MKKKLQLSVLDLVPVLEGVNATCALEQAVRLAQTAERIGYRRYWAAEHHDMPGLACASPEILLAHIGARTESIRLGSGAVLLPHYKPLKVAETFQMLASLYPGRIDLGLGRAPGGSGEASLALSGNFIENVGKMPELLDGLMRLLEGKYEYDGVGVAARPVPPEPPMPWLLGTNKKSSAYAAQFGTGYVFGQFMSDSSGEEAIAAYRTNFQPSPLGFGPSAIVAVGVVCADTDEEAERLAEASLGSFRQAASEREGMSGSRLLTGSPGSLKSRLEALALSYEVDEFIVVTMIPDYKARLRSYELLGRALLEDETAGSF